MYSRSCSRGSVLLFLSHGQSDREANDQCDKENCDQADDEELARSAGQTGPSPFRTSRMWYLLCCFGLGNCGCWGWFALGHGSPRAGRILCRSFILGLGNGGFWWDRHDYHVNSSRSREGWDWTGKKEIRHCLRRSGGRR